MHKVWNILNRDFYTVEGQAVMEELYGSVLMTSTMLGINHFKQLYASVNENSREWNRIAEAIIQAQSTSKTSHFGQGPLVTPEAQGQATSTVSMKAGLKEMCAKHNIAEEFIRDFMPSEFESSNL